MFNEKERCGTCKYHRRDDTTDGWFCANEESDYYSDFTEYKDKCEEWEGRR